jgi:ectoine hydroxylase-related dioxygenase (phytanoyl-CoA dioxygenase family)
MHNQTPRPVDKDEIATFQRDGVVVLRQLFNADWIDLLNRGLTANRAQPSPRARVWYRDKAGRSMFWDSQAWQTIPEYQEFIYRSPAASIAGQLLQAQSINFFFDAVFVRTPGTQFSTPWHQDEPYWSVEGYDTCTLWMPLMAVEKASALAFVPGSHRSDSVFYQYNFGSLNPDDKTNVDQSDFSNVGKLNIPDIDADPEAYGVTSWAMQPGDCVAFNGRTFHGGSGLLDDSTGLSVFTSKWLGDDARIKFRECGMDPDHTDCMLAAGLKEGDRPSTDLYPQIWRR